MGPLKGTFQLYMITLIPPISTPVSNIVQQQLVNTLTQSWYVDKGLGYHFNPQIAALTAACERSFQTSLDAEVWISNPTCCAVLAV